jgi:ferredoxin
MSDIEFYYFSGTGNSKHVVDWFGNYSKAKGVDVSIIDISKKSEKPIEPGKDTVVGFASPTHGFNFPPIMLYFLFKFPSTVNRNKVFIMNTRGGLKLWKIFLPGYSGIALWLASLILLLKGYRIIGLRSIDLPSNWQFIHPSQGKKVVNSMFEHYQSHVYQFAEKIISGKRVFKPSMILSFFIDIPIAPIALGYFFIGRFVFAKTFMASASCDNCGVCIQNCPIKAISLVNNRPFWSYKCESCMRCMDNCPKRAIEAAHGFIIVVMVLTFAVFITLLYSFIPLLKFFEGNTIGIEILKSVFESIVFLAVLVVTYKLVHFLKQYRWFDILITYTSFSKLLFWRRYKAPKI